MSLLGFFDVARGYDPLDDAIDYGRDLLPILRQEMARRDAAGERAAVPAAG